MNECFFVQRYIIIYCNIIIISLILQNKILVCNIDKPRINTGFLSILQNNFMFLERLVRLVILGIQPPTAHRKKR